jgi:hypothetical protein
MQIQKHFFVMTTSARKKNKKLFGPPAGPTVQSLLLTLTKASVRRKLHEASRREAKHRVSIFLKPGKSEIHGLRGERLRRGADRPGERVGSAGGPTGRASRAFLRAPDNALNVGHVRAYLVPERRCVQKARDFPHRRIRGPRSFKRDSRSLSPTSTP